MSRCLSSPDIRLSWEMRAESCRHGAGRRRFQTINAASPRRWKKCWNEVQWLGLMVSFKRFAMKKLIKIGLSLGWLGTLAVPCFASDLAVLRNGFSIRHERRQRL